jgi:hypothetical protein
MAWNYVLTDFQVRHPHCVEYANKYKYIYNTVIHNFIFYSIILGYNCRSQ